MDDEKIISPLRAIRLKCLDCCGGYRSEVGLSLHINLVLLFPLKCGKLVVEIFCNLSKTTIYCVLSAVFINIQCFLILGLTILWTVFLRGVALQDRATP